VARFSTKNSSKDIIGADGRIAFVKGAESIDEEAFSEQFGGEADNTAQLRVRIQRYEEGRAPFRLSRLPWQAQPYVMRAAARVPWAPLQTD